MLNETQLKKLDSEIEQHNKAIEEAVVSITEARSRQKSALAEINELTTLIESLQQERKLANQTILDSTNTKLQSEQSLQLIRKELEEDAHEKTVVEMMEKQISFNEALEARMKHHRNELNGGLDLPSGSKTFEEFLGVFCNYRADGIPIFSHESNLMNGAEKSYLKAIRLICEKSILKKQITADDKRQRLFVLDNFLFDRLVEKHWA
ncbi:hypothetical protein OAR36_13700 [Pseudomonadales bacterium]|nr:hypothetical protein [Pseudomonadales bacterium]